MAAPSSPSRPARPPASGPGGGWRAFARLPVPALAWEFLRRNPDYRVEYGQTDDAEQSRSVGLRWGLEFAADPLLSADETGVFWRAEIAPALVVRFDRGIAATSYRPPQGTTREAASGVHVRLGSGLQMTFPKGVRQGGPLAVLLTFDGDLGLRLRAVDALDRTVSGRPPAPSQLTMLQRQRLGQSLCALDGALDGRSYRDIAQAIFGSVAGGEAWRTSSLRDVTIRLVRTGRAMMRGGYLKLLRRGL